MSLEKFTYAEREEHGNAGERGFLQTKLEALVKVAC